MSRDTAAAERRPTTETSTAANESPTPGVAALLDRVEQQLAAGHPRKAMELVTHSSEVSPWVKNALGVCHLRLEHASTAVDLFRGIAVESGVYLRKTAPALFKANFATALLLTDNVTGFLRTLDDLHDVAHPEVERLRNLVKRWMETLSIWQILCWNLFGVTPPPPTVDFPPGAVK